MKKNNSKNKDQKTKVAIVSGAAGGLGQAISYKFITQGYNVVMVDKVDLKHLSNKFKQSNKSKILYLKLDIKTPQNIELITNETLKKFGRIDVLVNNAGISIGSGVLDFTLKDWEQSISVNLTSPTLLSQKIANIMIKKQISGSIVNVSSLTAFKGSLKPQYAASKAGLLGITKSFALGLGKYGIRVNAVVPGVIDTPLIKDWSKEKLTKIGGESPLNKIATPEEVANVIAFLASSEASFITGAWVDVTGGRL